MIKVLIVEDEELARESLSRTLKKCYPDLSVIATTGSIRDTVRWISTHPDDADLIFMDVELSDGSCFEIFRQTDITAKVIMTTAYDNYAIKAFEVNSVDYILKPVEETALKRAMERCIARDDSQNMKRFQTPIPAKAEYRQRYIVRMNDKIVPVRTTDIAYFYSEEKNTILVTFGGTENVMDMSLDVLSEELDPEMFFRVSRSCIVNIQSIESIVRHTGSRLRILTVPESRFEMTVSRSRVEDFMQWIEGTAYNGNNR